MPLPTKDELAQRLERFPLLRQMVYEFWFRVVFLSMLLGALGLALLLPKIWRVTPGGMEPVVRVSLLDFLQAWSLKRNALQAEAAGKPADAAFAWQSAIANNPADPDLIRGTLRNFLLQPGPGKYANHCMRQSFWLRRLTGTNANDLELCAEVYFKNHYYDLVLEALDPLGTNLPPAGTVVYLKTLFLTGQTDEFARRLAPATPLVDGNAELRLFRAAYQAGWGTLAEQTAGETLLASATADPKLKTLAHQLQLRVAKARHDLNAYVQALKQLEDLQQDQLEDHIGHWWLLVEADRRDEAASLVRAYPRAPATASEVLGLARTYAMLNLPAGALETLKRFSPEFGYDLRLWVLRAKLLIETKQWEELRALALEVRQIEGIRERLTGYSFYLEGQAELSQGRTANAEAAFKRLAGADLDNNELALETAYHVLRLGDPRTARDLLLKAEPGFQTSPQLLRFLLVLFDAADAVKDTDLMLRAITQAYTQRPDDPTIRNNYAAVLLILRQRPEEVIKFTLDLQAQYPNSSVATINHALALILNRRDAEAEALLKRVDLTQLTRAQTSLYHLDLFEARLNLGKLDEARDSAAKVETRDLYPSQAAWFEKARQRLAPATPSATAR